MMICYDILCRSVDHSKYRCKVSEFISALCSRRVHSADTPYLAVMFVSTFLHQHLQHKKNTTQKNMFPGYQTPVKIPHRYTYGQGRRHGPSPAHVAITLTERKFEKLSMEGQLFFTTATCPVIRDLESVRRRYITGQDLPFDTYFDQVVLLLSTLGADLAVHRKVAAILRYLTTEIIVALSHVAKDFEKLVLYFQPLDWTSVTRVLQSEKARLLAGIGNLIHNKACYIEAIDTQLTPVSTRKPPITPTPSIRKRPRATTPEVCPYLQTS